MAEPLITITGIRSDEQITNRPGAKQNAGMVLQVRGFYPPSQGEVMKANPLILRDTFNLMAFFARMTANGRKKWLLSHSTTKDDLYMEDTQKITARMYKSGIA